MIIEENNYVKALHDSITTRLLIGLRNSLTRARAMGIDVDEKRKQL